MHHSEAFSQEGGFNHQPKLSRLSRFEWSKKAITGFTFSLAAVLAASNPAEAQLHRITNLSVQGMDVQPSRVIGEQIEGLDHIISTAHGFEPYQIPYLIASNQITFVSKPLFCLTRNGLIVEGIIATQPRDTVGLFNTYTTSVINSDSLEVTRSESTPDSLPYEHIAIRNQNGDIFDLSQYDPTNGDSGGIIFDKSTNKALGIYIGRSEKDGEPTSFVFISTETGEYFGDLFSIIKVEEDGQGIGRILNGSGFIEVLYIGEDSITLMMFDKALPVPLVLYEQISNQHPFFSERVDYCDKLRHSIKQPK